MFSLASFFIQKKTLVPLALVLALAQGAEVPAESVSEYPSPHAALSTVIADFRADLLALPPGQRCEMPAALRSECRESDGIALPPAKKETISQLMKKIQGRWMKARAEWRERREERQARKSSQE